MKKTNLKLLLMIFTALVTFSCDPEDGMDGAIGPQGEQGLSGTDGVDGQNGQDGNANVIASPWIPSEFSDTPSSYEEFSFTDPSLTAEITSNAAILVYGRAGFSGVVVGLPIPLGNQSYYYYVNPALNHIVFAGESVDSTDETFDTFLDFRYVIIPANTSGKSSQPNFSKMPYEEVMDYLGLEY